MSRLGWIRVVVAVLAVSYIAYSLAAAIGYCRAVPLWFMIPFFAGFFALAFYAMILGRRKRLGAAMH